MRAICDGVADIAKVHEATHRAGEVVFELRPNPQPQEPMEKHIKVMKHKDMVAERERLKGEKEKEKLKQSEDK